MLRILSVTILQQKTHFTWKKYNGHALECKPSQKTLLQSNTKRIRLSFKIISLAYAMQIYNIFEKGFQLFEHPAIDQLPRKWSIAVSSCHSPVIFWNLRRMHWVCYLGLFLLEGTLKSYNCELFGDYWQGCLVCKNYLYLAVYVNNNHVNYKLKALETIITRTTPLLAMFIITAYCG